MTKLIFSIDDVADKQLMLALGRRLNLPVEELETEGVTEEEFWKIIDLVDLGTNNLTLAAEALAKRSEEEIKSFAELLAAKLFALDKRTYADLLIGKSAGDYFSPDHFLDVRAFVVASGKTYFLSVLAGEEVAVKPGICEQLISLPAMAWKQRTGKDFNYLPAKNYFTYSNPDGWENTLLDQLLQK